MSIVGINLLLGIPTYISIICSSTGRNLKNIILSTKTLLN